MNPPKWTRGGAFAPTATATAFSLIAVPIGGLGILAMAFRVIAPGAIMTTGGLILWLTGRWLLNR